jgi:hypothetical protein
MVMMMGRTICASRHFEARELASERRRRTRTEYEQHAQRDRP